MKPLTFTRKRTKAAVSNEPNWDFLWNRNRQLALLSISEGRIDFAFEFRIGVAVLGVGYVQIGNGVEVNEFSLIRRDRY